MQTKKWPRENSRGHLRSFVFTSLFLGAKRHDMRDIPRREHFRCQLQPEVLPHDGHAWHEPARCICTPHCMHIGASLCVMTRGMPCAGEWSVLGASGARPALICAASSPAEGMVFGSCAISLPLLVSTMVSSTPGNVGCKRSSRLKMPSSTRSS